MTERTEKIECQKFEECSATLCPLDEISMSGGIWYSDEEICQARKFQRLPWVKKQKLVVKAGASNDKYFTVEMLENKKQIRKGIEGIDPDQPIDKADAEEKKWAGIKVKRGRKAKQVVANESKKSKRVVAKKRRKLSKRGKKKRGRPKKK